MRQLQKMEQYTNTCFSCQAVLARPTTSVWMPALPVCTSPTTKQALHWKLSPLVCSEKLLVPSLCPGADAALNRVKWTVAWRGRLILLKVTFKAFINESRLCRPTIHCRNKNPPWWLKWLYWKVGGKILPRLEAIQVIRVCARRLGTFRLLQWINQSRSEQINPILRVQIWPEWNLQQFRSFGGQKETLSSTPW